MVRGARRVARSFADLLRREARHPRNVRDRIDLKEYRDLLGDLALRHIRVMGVENASHALVGPHLPPVVSGGRTVNAAGARRRKAPPPRPAPAKTEKPVSLIIDGNVRSGQSIVHPDGDVTIVGRVASGAEIVAGGSVHVYGALAGPGDRRHLGIARRARIFCREARAELICIGGVYITAEDMDPAARGPEPRGPAGRARNSRSGSWSEPIDEDQTHEQGDRRHIR